MRRLLGVVLVVMLVAGGLTPIPGFLAGSALAETTRTSSEAVILSEPAASASFVSLVPADTDVIVVGPPVGEFHPVSVGGATGWMWSGALTVDKGAADAAPASVGGMTTAAEEATSEPLAWEPENAPADSDHVAQETSSNDLNAAQPAPAQPAPSQTPVPDVVDSSAPVATPAADPAAPAPEMGDASTTTAPVAMDSAAPAPDSTTTAPAADQNGVGETPPTTGSFAAPSDGGAAPPDTGAALAPAATVTPAATDALAPALEETVPPSPTEAAVGDPMAPAAAPGTPTAVSPAEESPTATTSPATTAAPNAAPAQGQGPIGPATVSTGANLRGAPDESAWIVFAVPAGSTVEQTGQRQNGYVSATYMWMDGWLAEGVLQSPVAVAAEAPTATPPPDLELRTPRTGSGVAFTTVELSLRQGPSANEVALMTIPAGARVVMTGVMENGFHRVTYQENVGWLASDYLSTPPDPEPTAGNTGESNDGGGRSGGHGEYSRDEITQIIYAAADRYGQSRQDMLRVATCESNLDPYAVNPSGSYGLFQFIRSTWKSTPYGDESMFDPAANSNAAAWMWQQGRKSEWVCK